MAAPSSSETPSSTGLAVLSAPTMSLDSSIAPPIARSRTLVVCFDGTANQYDGENTNVVKFYSLLKKDDTEQLCYYQPGVGTYFQPGVVSPLFTWCAKILDEAVAWYLDAHVRGGYTFLMQNYRPGDKICIFGFSRGAYTARALGGFLHKIGLLPKDNPEQVPIAYKLFGQTDPESVQLAAGFKQTFCRSVQIEFMGVWDTVASVGVLMSKTLPFTTTNTTIKTFRHALSLDERRTKFQPNLYHRLSPNATRTVKDMELELAIADEQNAAEGQDMSPTSPTSVTTESCSPDLKAKDHATGSTAPASQQQAREHRTVGVPPGKISPKGKGDKWRPFPRVRRLVRRGHHDAADRSRNEKHTIKNMDLSAVTDPSDDFIGITDVQEVWFAGCHGNVGGGSTPNDSPYALSDIPLRWMVREVVQSQCGLQFDRDALARANIPESIFTGEGFPLTSAITDTPTRGGKIQPTLHYFTEPHPQRSAQKKVAQAIRRSEDSYASNMTSTTTSSYIDAVQPIDDELKKKWAWWLLEIIPTSYTFQDGRGNWHTKWSIHLGRGRLIPDIKPNFHESVKARMDDKDLNYKPRATWCEGTETYVS